MLFFAAFIWGIAFVAQKAASSVSLFALCTSRSIIAAIVLIPAVMLFDRLSKNERKLFSSRGIDVTRRELVGGILCGISLFTATALQQAGINGTDAGKASFITALYVVIVPIYALIFKRKSPLNVWLGVGISVIGFYLLCIKDDLSVLPADLLVFACAFVYAVQIMTIDHFAASCDCVRLSLIQFFTVSLFSFAGSLIFEGIGSFATVSECIPEILFLGVGSSGIAYTLQIIGQKNTHPAVASIVLSLESVIGAVASALILGEVLSAREYVGCAIVFISVVISQLDLSFIFGKAHR